MSGPSAPRIEGVDTEGMRAFLEGTAVRFAVLFGSHARESADSGSDVDVALEFPDGMSDEERFRLRNRIDAELQEYADEFVDVSDFDTLPVRVVHTALRDGVALVGDESEIETYRATIDEQYEATADQRKRERQEFIDRLARGDV